MREIKTHDLKTWPRFFNLVISGRKTFEIRTDDRDFQAGDYLLLREWDDMQQDYTGRSVRVRVVDVFSLRPLYDAVGMPFVMMGEEPPHA